MGNFMGDGFGVGHGTCVHFSDFNSGSCLLLSLQVRRRVGVVSQDTALFDNTIAYNIRYGNLTADDDAVRSAAAAAQVRIIPPLKEHAKRWLLLQQRPQLY